MCKSRKLVDAVLEEKKTGTDILLLTNRHTTLDRGGEKQRRGEGQRRKRRSKGRAMKKISVAVVI